MKTIRDNCGVPVIMLTPDNIRDYIGDILNPQWRRLNQIAQKTDVLRLAVLLLNGGAWIDADTLFLHDFKHLFNTDVDFVGFRWTHIRDFSNAYWLCQKGSKFIQACLDGANKDLKESPQAYYPSAGGGYFGSELFGRVERAGDFQVQEVPMDTFIPVNFPLKPSIWHENLAVEPWITKHTVAIALTNSQFGDDIKAGRVETLAQRHTLLGSALRYAGVKADPEPTTANLSGEDLASWGLPKGFGPGHPDWMQPSKRQKYMLMMEYKAGTRFDGKFCVMTIFSGNYQWYAPLFIDRVKKELPTADCRVYVRGTNELPGYHPCIFRIEDDLSKDGYTTAALRFLYSDKALEEYNYCLITDVDMLLKAETPSIVGQHMRSIKKRGTVCYDNWLSSEPFSVPAMPGVHFVTQEWWAKTKMVRAKHLELLGNIDANKGFDERLLGQIIIDSQIPMPPREPILWAHHGIHLGQYRVAIEAKHDMPSLGNNSDYAQKLLKDQNFIELVRESGEKIPTLKKTFEWFAGRL
jgi:hypothetical protein